MSFTLIDLIKKLQKLNPDKVLKVGLKNPHSYRGDYSCLAFEPAENITVRDVLIEVLSALNNTYAGYKGGVYTMTEYTYFYIAKEGDTGEQIGDLLMSYILGEI